MNAFRRSLVVLLLLLIPAVSGSALTNRIAVLLDGGRGDLSFNDMGYKGASEAADRFGLELVTVQSVSASDNLPNLRNLARTGEFDLIISFGSLLADAISQAADEYPDQRFVTVGGYVPDRPNVMAIVFRDNEVSALIGALAAMTASHYGISHVGIVLGMTMPVLHNFEAGYRFGVAWGQTRFLEATGTRSDVEVLYTYAGTFRDIAIGKAAAEAMLAMGAGSVFNVAGALGLGIHEAITEHHESVGTSTGPPYYFGVDANQDYLGGGHYGLASAMKRIDRATLLAVEGVVNGTFEGGIRSLGLAESALGISGLDDLVEFIGFGMSAGAISEDSFYETLSNWAGNRATVPAWIWEAIVELEAGIVEETIVVSTAQSLDEIEALRVQDDSASP